MGTKTIQQALNEFADEFNNYLTNQNAANSKVNQRTAYGYWLAAGLALFCTFLEWRDKLATIFVNRFKSLRNAKGAGNRIKT